MDAIPVYVDSLKSGILQSKIEQARSEMKACTLCPRRCRVNRLEGQTGFCKTAERAIVASYGPHFGEEDPLVGRAGSGTIFFTHCNLLCVFCQNYDISHLGEGRAVTDEQLAEIMLELQKSGCHNINFVTPSHVIPQIIAAVMIAAEKGLNVPLVYNSGGYDSVETIEMLDGIIDIYMPDFKFWDPRVAEQACNAADYPETARKAISAMHAQVGDLVLNQDGIAVRGLLVRHLVLPNDLAGTGPIMRFLANQISPNTYVNVMSQYRPCAKAGQIEKLSRRLAPGEYSRAVELARDAGLTRLDKPHRVFVLW